MNLKILFISFLLLLNLSGVFALQVQPTEQHSATTLQQSQDLLGQINWSLIVFWASITTFACIILGLIFWIMWKIYKKITEERRTKDNTEYRKYLSDIKMCKINSDKKYFYRQWWSFWLFTKRAPIYARTSTGDKYIGNYMGEAVKKDGMGYFILGIEQRHSFFNREIDVVVFPYDLSKEIYKKNDDFSLTLVCEGIDEAMSSEFYSIPVIMNKESSKNSDKKFIDFSNLVMKDYFQEYVYRDVIKENIKEFRENIKQATEMNSTVQMDRKTSSNLKE